MITPNESITFRPRKLPADQSLPIPLLLVVGDSRGEMPPVGVERVATFTGSLVVGRKSLSEVEPGQSSLVLPDRMISGQHFR